jgi:hypothetical protein
MSIDYRTMTTIKFADLFDGRLARFGIADGDHMIASDFVLGEGKIAPGPLVKTPGSDVKSLTDGENYLTVFADDDGNLSLMKASALLVNNPYAILATIAEVFATDIVSEYDHQFWGYDTAEEWEATMAALEKQAADRFYDGMIEYLKGGPDPYVDNPGCIGDREVQIAKELVADDPDLVAPENRDRLLAAVEAAYEKIDSTRARRAP